MLLGRCCGFRYATGVAQALIRSEIQDLDSNNEEKVQQSFTFAALVVSIRDILIKEMDVREHNPISFSAKADLEWRARTAFPLSTYKEKWESLRIVSQDISSDASSVRFSDITRLPISQAKFRLKRLAYNYMKSYPGDRQFCCQKSCGSSSLQQNSEGWAIRETRAWKIGRKLKISFEDNHDSRHRIQKIISTYHFSIAWFAT